MKHLLRCGVMFAFGLMPAFAAAQGSDIELGATRPSQVELHAGRRSEPAVDEGGNELRIGVQARLDESLVLSRGQFGGGMFGAAAASGQALLVPVIAPGVRWLDGRLYTGLGLGLTGGNADNGGGTSNGRAGFSLAPLALYDVLRQDALALAVGGWLNLAHLGETETCVRGACMDANDDVTAWGLTLVGSLRGTLTRGLALGGEFGWGFLSTSEDDGPSSFLHGLFGAIMLEATIGI